MNKDKIEKLNRFVKDIGMSDAVYDVLLKSFLKPVEGDVQMQAAAKIALDLLQVAWKDLQKYKSSEEGTESRSQGAL